MNRLNEENVVKKILKVLMPVVIVSVVISAFIYKEKPINYAEYDLLGEDATAKFLGKSVDTDYYLYSENKDDLSLKQIAVFPPREEYDVSLENRIVDFGVCGDWIILCVGFYQGSGLYFAGDFVRVKRDGSELKHFWITDDDEFEIVKDWIYYNFWTLEDHPDNIYGCYRIHPDGTGKEYLGDKIASIIQYESDGYIYGYYDTGKAMSMNTINNLIRCKPDGSGRITLFKGSTLPLLKEADAIKYEPVKVVGDWVTFTASVHGYVMGDSWRGRNIYEAQYRVKKDGSGLTLLSETYYNK